MCSLGVQPVRPASINSRTAHYFIKTAAGSTHFPAEPLVITRIQIACRVCCVDGNRPVVVMSVGPRIETFRMTRSITHVIKFSLNDTFFFLILSLGTKSAIPIDLHLA